MTELNRAVIAKARRFAQPQLKLEGLAVSIEAKAFVAHCLAIIVLPSLPSQRQRPSSLAAIERAVEGTLSGLSLAAGDGWLRRPMSNDSFTSEPVSIRQFRKALNALLEAGLVRRIEGYADWTGAFGKSADTRLSLSENGWRLAASFGIERDDVRLHFDAESEGLREDQEGRPI